MPEKVFGYPVTQTSALGAHLTPIIIRQHTTTHTQYILIFIEYAQTYINNALGAHLTPINIGLKTCKKLGTINIKIHTI